MCLQNVSDILLFKTHNDPQLRGAIRTLISNFLKTISYSSNKYEKWLEINATLEQATELQEEKLINIFLKVNPFLIYKNDIYGHIK